VAKSRRSDCAVACALDLLGDKWTLLIVRDLLFAEALKFADFTNADESIPSNTLADRLRRLKDAGIVESHLYSDRPRRYSYSLTDHGKNLAPVVNALAEFGLSHFSGTRRLGLVR
jgi:DNA-binding HxlR family transcriptional regulator